MTISQVSEMFDMTPDTLRYYEKLGLIGPVKKKSGIRDYEESDLKRIEFVKCMRNAGLEVVVLKKYLDLFELGDKTLEQRRDILVTQSKILKERLDQINTAYERLQYKIKLYDDKVLEKKLKNN